VIASTLPSGALTANAILSTAVIFSVSTCAGLLARRRRRSQRQDDGPPCLGLKPGVLPREVVSACRRAAATRFERDIAALRQLEYVPDEWLSS
jgi:hypothetical protein